MFIRTISALLLLMLAPLARADEQTVEQSIAAQSRSLILNRDLAGFDRLASAYRDSREETPGGFSKLALLYNGIEGIADDPRDVAWAHARIDAEAWLQSHPDSPSAVVIAAKVLAKKAWSVRGHGLAYTVDAEHFERFDTLVEGARQILDDHREVGERDPEWYALRISVANWQGEKRDKVMERALQAAGREPYYQPIHYAAMIAMQPKWGGSTALSTQYLGAALPLTAPRLGEQLYARVYLYMLRSSGDYVAAELKASGAEWPALKASLQQVLAAYPDAWNANAYRIMACAYGTGEDYRQAMAALDGQYGGKVISLYPVDTAVWRQSCDDWAQGKAARLEPPVNSVNRAADGRFYLCITIGIAVLLLLVRRHRLRGRQWPPGAGADADPAAPRSAGRRGSINRLVLLRVGVLVGLVGLHEVYMHRSREADQAYDLTARQAEFTVLQKSVASAQASGQAPGAQLWIDYANAAWAMQRRDAVDEALRQLEELQPRDGHILSQMGYLYIQETRMPEAWQAVQRGAALGDTWSQYSVAKTLYLGCDDIHLKADPAAGMAWFRTAAALGDAQAAQVLKVEPWGHALTWLYITVA